MESTASRDFLGLGCGLVFPELPLLLLGDFCGVLVILIVFSEFVSGLLGFLTYVLSQTGEDGSVSREGLFF